MNNSGQKLSFTSMLPVFIVYIVWGSTYLAIRFVVREGSGFPPFAAASTRYLAAGGAVWLWARIAGKQLKPSRQEWVTLALAGVLMMAGGNWWVPSPSGRF